MPKAVAAPEGRPSPRRVVAKVGTSTLIGPDGRLDEAFIGSLADQAMELRAEGRDVVVVSSGAISAALPELGLPGRPADIPTLQACASVGQVALIGAYARAFEERGACVGQILLTRNDTGSRSAYLHAREAVDRLLSMGAVPVVNENDTVAVDEIRFGDNDSLAAIVGALVGADLVVLLSDIDGLYTADPHIDPSATLIPVVRPEGSEEAQKRAGGPASGVGTGGMSTKVRAGVAMQMAGVPLVVCQGRRPGVLVAAAHGESVGTRFEPAPDGPREPARKLWIGFAGHDSGCVEVDDGAREALHAGGSLLPVGVVRVEGRFSRGDVVAVRDGQGTLVARGITAYSSDEAELARGMRLDLVGRVIPALAGMPLIHRDEMVIF